MTTKTVRKIMAKENKANEKEMKREVKSVIRTLKADIKKAAKKGVSDFCVKMRNVEVYTKAKLYFKGKGFRCWEYTSEDCKYLAIEW